MFSLLFLVLFLNALTSVQSVDNIQANIVSEYSKTDEALWSKNQKLNKHDFHTDTLLMDFLQTTNSFKDNSYDFTLKELRNALTKILKKNKVQKRHVADRIGKLLFLCRNHLYRFHAKLVIFTRKLLLETKNFIKMCSNIGFENFISYNSSRYSPNFEKFIRYALGPSQY